MKWLVVIFLFLGGCDDEGSAPGPEENETDGGNFQGSTGPRTLVCSEAANAHNQDDDGDGFSECEGDCDDTDTDFYPDAPDVEGDQIDHACDNYLPTKT